MLQQYAAIQTEERARNIGRIKDYLQAASDDHQRKDYGFTRTSSFCTHILDTLMMTLRSLSSELW